MPDGHIVFMKGDSPLNPSMYLVAKGVLDYTSENTGEVEVGDGKWISEASLWIPWMHLGTLTTQCECLVCILESSSFTEIVGQFEHPHFDPRSYANRFLAEMRQRRLAMSDLSPGPDFYE